MKINILNILIEVQHSKQVHVNFRYDLKSVHILSVAEVQSNLSLIRLLNKKSKLVAMFIFSTENKMSLKNSTCYHKLNLETHS